MRESTDGGVRPAAILAALLFISVLLMVVTGSNIRGRFSGVGPSILSFIQRTMGRLSGEVGDAAGSLREIRQLRADYREAVDKLASYRGLERDLIELRRENATLKEQLGFIRDWDHDHVPARVIARDPTNLFATITLDKGRRDGVREDMPVMSYQDGIFGLVGKVVSSGPRTAMVRPLTDPSSHVAALLMESRYQGLIDGLGTAEEQLAMRYVTKGALGRIGISDLIVTSGMNSLYPPDLYIGRVREVRAREYDTSLEILVDPVIDYSRLEYLIVLIDDPPEGEGG